MVVCPQCYHENPDDAGQCETCSTPLPTQSNCPTCGATVLSDANFCGQCGTKLDPGGDPPKGGTPMAQVSKELFDGDPVAIAPEPAETPMATTGTGTDIDLDLGRDRDGVSPSVSAAESLSDAEAEWLAEEDNDDDPDDDLELSWEAPPTTPMETEKPVSAVTNFDNFETFMTGVESVATSSEDVDDVEPDPSLNGFWADAALEEEPEEGGDELENELEGELENELEGDRPPMAEGVVLDPQTATVLQSHEKGQLLHLQTNTSLPLSRGQKVVHIGKTNTRVPPDIDVTDFPHAEIVSRIHADLHWDGSSYYLEDTGSANGTYVNSWPLPAHHRYQLRDGDRITLGKHDLISFIFQIIS